MGIQPAFAPPLAHPCADHCPPAPEGPRNRRSRRRDPRPKRLSLSPFLPSEVPGSPRQAGQTGRDIAPTIPPPPRSACRPLLRPIDLARIHPPSMPWDAPAPPEPHRPIAASDRQNSDKFPPSSAPWDTQTHHQQRFDKFRPILDLRRTIPTTSATSCRHSLKSSHDMPWAPDGSPRSRALLFVNVTSCFERLRWHSFVRLITPCTCGLELALTVRRPNRPGCMENCPVANGRGSTFVCVFNRRRRSPTV